jgi:predicted anti-sigma-YlaC factor YlaD
MAGQCGERLRALSDYLDGELDEQLCAEIEQHLADCGDCRILVDTLRRTVTLYRTHGHEPLPPQTKDRLYAVLNLPKAS